MKRVHVVNCPRLDCVMNLEECRLLECVDLRGSVRLDKINGLKKCEWLRRVDLCGTYVRSLTPLERCKCLDLITIDKAVKGWQSFAPGVVRLNNEFRFYIIAFLVKRSSFPTFIFFCKMLSSRFFSIAFLFS